MAALGPTIIDDPFAVIRGGERDCDPLPIDDPFAVYAGGIDHSKKHARDEGDIKAAAAPTAFTVPAPRLEPYDWIESDPFIKGVFAVSNRNRVRDVWGRIREATINDRGYRVVEIYGNRWLHHRLVYLLWYGCRPNGQIDHRNGEKSDNWPDNLEDVTPSENMRRSHANPTRRNAGEQKSRPIVGKLGDGEPREFLSATIAARELNMTSGNISGCCTGRIKSTCGWTFAYQDQPDLTGEEWRPIQGIEVSSCGRMRTTRSGKHFPNPRVDGYCAIGIRGQAFQFHRLVCQAFHGEPPKGSQADHVDGNQRNNRADNLQWLSAVENVAKRQRKLTMSTGRAITTSIGGRYDSLTHASDATGLRKSHIVKLCNAGTQHRQHGAFAYAEADPIEGEVFKNVTEADLLKLGRESSRDHVTMG
jgi:hypothetical protein